MYLGSVEGCSWDESCYLIQSLTFKSSQAGASKDIPCIIVYLESGGCVKERALRVLSGITKKDHLFLSEVGETGEKTAAEGV